MVKLLFKSPRHRQALKKRGGGFIPLALEPNQLEDLAIIQSNYGLNTSEAAIELLIQREADHIRNLPNHPALV
jgi:hypothetical protein